MLTRSLHVTAQDSRRLSNVSSHLDNNMAFVDMFRKYGYVLLLLVSCLKSTDGRQSVWTVSLTEKTSDMFTLFPNSMYEGGYVTLKVKCSSPVANGKIKLAWSLQKLGCLSDMFTKQSMLELKENIQLQLASNIFNSRHMKPERFENTENFTEVLSSDFQVSDQTLYACGASGTTSLIELPDNSGEPYYHGVYYDTSGQLDELITTPHSASIANTKFIWHTLPQNRIETPKIQYLVTRPWDNGLYHFCLSVKPVGNMTYTATASVEMRGANGYLPAILWPELPVRGVCSFLFLTVATVWIVVWARAHQHTLKIHLVIGGVAVAGGMASTLAFVDLSTKNSNGLGVPGMAWIGWFLASCQVAGTQLLLMVVATGYGITRPILEKKIQRGAVTLGVLSFFASVVVHVISDEDLQLRYNYMKTSLVLGVVSLFVWLVVGGWITIYSILTFIHLRRRNHATKKVIVFCIFAGSCVFAFVGLLAVIGLQVGMNISCAQNGWRWAWLFDVFVDLEVLLLLTVIMWLWRPSDESQSYAFTPLASEEHTFDDDDEDVESFNIGNHGDKKIQLEPMIG